ncbi:MAG: esterase-like activity of phytase family protein [Paracoccaceae bacterium]
MLKRTVVGLTVGLFAILGMGGSARPIPPPGLIGDFNWHGSGELFGGFSALNVSADGARFVALSDQGGIVAGQFQRNAAGVIVGVTNGVVEPLLGPTGKRLGQFNTDSEGMAVAPDGTIFVSFEGPAMVRRYAHLGASAETMPKHPDFAFMAHNTSLESLAIGADGTLYTLPETSGVMDRPFKIYRLRNGAWDQPTSIPRRGWFLVSDATVGPDGRFYVLERQFLGFRGFASRIRRFTFEGDALTHEEQLLRTMPGTHDNLEGLSVWRDPAGHLRATMVSDDNFLFFFRNEIVEYRLPD